MVPEPAPDIPPEGFFDENGDIDYTGTPFEDDLTIN